MFDNWIDVLLRGSYELGLPELAITRGGERLCAGGGHLSWSGGSRLRVRAVTDGADLTRTILDDFGNNISRVGRLIPRDQFVVLSGWTREGWEVTTPPNLMDGCSMSWQTDRVVWDYEAGGMRICRRTEGSYDHGRSIRAVFSPSPEHWTRGTTTRVENPHFGGTASQLDWVQAETSFGVVAARRRGDDRFEVYIRVDQPPAREGTLALLSAVSVAFGVLVGRRVSVLGYEEIAETSQTRDLSAVDVRPGDRVYQPPFGRHQCDAELEAWLTRAIDYFLTEQGLEVARHLLFCWETAGALILTRQTVFSICLEGLVRLAARREGLPVADPVRRDVQAARDWLDASREGVTTEFANRMSGFLGSVLSAERRTIDVLRDWQSRSILGVSREDVEAWRLIRHPAAHGSMIGREWEFEELDEEVVQLTRLNNLVNRIVLQLAGYRGRYIDYALPGWPLVEFPAADPAEL